MYKFKNLYGNEDDSILDWSNKEVISSDIKTFLKEGYLEVKEYTDEELEDLYPCEDIVNYARACIGDKGYDLVFNNCEHFANVCTLGKHRSIQIEKILEYGENDMDIFKGLFGSKESKPREVHYTNKNYTYEPDKVRVAELENIRSEKNNYAKLEQINRIKNAQIEMIERENYFKMASTYLEHQCSKRLIEKLVDIKYELDRISSERIIIMHEQSNRIVEEVEKRYEDKINYIHQYNDSYNEIKLPKLMQTLEKYKDNQSMYEIYKKRVEDDVYNHGEYIRNELQNLSLTKSNIREEVNNNTKLLELNSNFIHNVIESIGIEVGNYNMKMIDVNGSINTKLLNEEASL